MKHRREKLSEDNVAFIIFCKYNKSTTSKSVKMLFVVTVSVLNREPLPKVLQKLLMLFLMRSVTLSPLTCWNSTLF